MSRKDHRELVRSERLRAAAPDMLEALEHVRDWNNADIAGFEDIAPNMDMLKARAKVLRTAIAKAKGKA